MSIPKRARIGSASLALSGIVACSGADERASREPEASAPVYALVTHVWTDDGPTGYVALSHSLDLGAVTLDEAREFPGYTSVAAIGGQLVVNPGAEDPTLTRYQISDDLEWTEPGERLSFANQGVDEIGFYKQYLHRDREALVDVDVTGRVLWRPVDFELHGSGPDVDLPLQRDGLDLFANFNRGYFVAANEILQPFSYHDQDWFRWSGDTSIVVYDPIERVTKDILTASCPGLDTITRDERGNTYLATWEYPAVQALSGGSAPCVVRLTADNELDPSWDPDLRAMSGGRHVVNFRYVGDGLAIAAVHHVEEYGEGFDFEGLAARVDDYWDAAARYHRLWVFDLNARSARPVQGITDFEFINPGFFHSVIDGRTFVFLADHSSNNSDTTSVYELDAGGAAERRFEVPGGVIQWVRVR